MAITRRVYPTRFEHVLAAHPGATFKAASAYPIERKPKALKAVLTVLAPHDDILEQTRRVKSMLKSGGEYVGLDEVGQDPFQDSLERMVGLITRHLPA